MSSCPGLGWVVLQPCSDLLECAVCGNQWQEKELMTSYAKAMAFLRNLFSLRVPQPILELLNAFLLELNHDQCPQCGILIYKTGGCPHMKCLKCSYDFCWRCKHNYKQGHTFKVCNQSVLSRFLVNSTIWLNISFLFGVTEIVGLLVYQTMYYLFNYLVYFNVCGALLIFLLYQLFNILVNPRFSTRKIR